MNFRRVASFKSANALGKHLSSLGLALPLDPHAISAADGSPLAQPIAVGSRTVGNRWCIHPMEGWDATPDGRPSDRTRTRWRHFGESGAKLIWGGEAYAVVPEGRANPAQLYDDPSRPQNDASLRELAQIVRTAHTERYGAGACDDLLLGLQLTHSGRFSCPNRHDTREPQLVYRHPVLDPWIGIRSVDSAPVLSDSDVRRLIDRFIQAAVAADRAGFDFVDIKHCHGYLGHEFLSAFDRPGPYGGDLRGRSRFLREVAAGVRSEAPRLLIGVRLSLFDGPPFVHDRSPQCGVPAAGLPQSYPIFGCDPQNPSQIDLREPIELLCWLQRDRLIDIVNFTAGIPYSNPHLQRPAAFPPSDGYPPPEDPLVGCVRQIDAAAAVKTAVPNLPAVGSAYTYFQEFLPHAAQAQVRLGRIDSVGIGRMVLSCWTFPDDVLSGRLPKRNLLCRTFSECTTAPRNGIVSGCYPLDPAYKHSPDGVQLEAVLAARRTAAEGGS